MKIHTFFILPILLIIGLGVILASPVHAQQEQETEEGNGQTEQTAQNEQSDGQQEGGGFINALKFWNWGATDAPDTLSPWHANVSNYLKVENDEYIRYGYTRINEDWLPIFFLRRFDMSDKQYVHTLVIKGQPKKSPKIKGIEMSEYGMVISNLGFDVRMPKFPSVSREKKGRDEKEAIKLCNTQLDLYGFDEIEWQPGEQEELRNLAETWEID